MDQTKNYTTEGCRADVTIKKGKKEISYQYWFVITVQLGDESLIGDEFKSIYFGEHFHLPYQHCKKTRSESIPRNPGQSLVSDI